MSIKRKCGAKAFDLRIQCNGIEVRRSLRPLVSPRTKSQRWFVSEAHQGNTNRRGHEACHIYTRLHTQFRDRRLRSILSPPQSDSPALEIELYTRCADAAIPRWAILAPGGIVFRADPWRMSVGPDALDRYMAAIVLSGRRPRYPHELTRGSRTAARRQRRWRKLQPRSAPRGATSEPAPTGASD